MTTADGLQPPVRGLVNHRLRPLRFSQATSTDNIPLRRLPIETKAWFAASSRPSASVDPLQVHLDRFQPLIVAEGEANPDEFQVSRFPRLKNIHPPAAMPTIMQPILHYRISLGYFTV